MSGMNNCLPGGAAQKIASVLSAWWTRPDPQTLALWGRPAYARQARAAWKAEMGEAGLPRIKELLSNLQAEQNGLALEYERLFVGPAAVPCPPYEVMWRTDRPPQERGTVMGQSTDEVKELYSQLGLRLRPEEVELPDHIAIELEAFAYASTVRPDVAESLLGRLRIWLPGFCHSVMTNSRLEFYRLLAGATLEYFSRANGSTGCSGTPLSGAKGGAGK